MEGFYVSRCEVGIDYLTVSATDQRGSEHLRSLGLAWLEVEEAAGGLLDSRTVSGYSGLAANDTFCGDRADGTLFRISGPRALLACQAIDFSLVNCTRLDVQVTVWYHGDYEELANTAYYQYALPVYEAAKEPAAKPVLIVGGGEGDTLQLGSRSSPRFGRLYDKWRESGDDAYHCAWRWEVEYKADAAAKMVQALGACDWDRRECAGYVVGQWAVWGVPLALPGIASIAPATLERAKTDTSAKLQWLKKQVRGTVGVLIEAGLSHEVMEALGLDNADGIG